MNDTQTRLLLEDMLVNARLAENFIRAVDVTSFETDTGLVYAATRAVEIVGEAAAQISPSARAALPSLPWREMIGMRNRLIHGYRKLEAGIVFGTIREDFPALIDELESLLSEKAKD